MPSAGDEGSSPSVTHPNPFDRRDMLTDKDAWMRTKPMKAKLHFISGDDIRSVPKTENRVKSVSPIFYDSKRDCKIALKEYCTQRAQFYLNKVRELEYDIAFGEE